MPWMGDSITTDLPDYDLYVQMWQKEVFLEKFCGDKKNNCGLRITEILKTGYCNIDAILRKLQNEKTYFKVNLEPSSKNIKSKVFFKALIFPSIVYLTPNQDYSSFTNGFFFKGVPVQIYALGENEKGELFFGTQKVTIKEGNETFTIKLKPSSKNEIEKELSK